jgi:GNAT superfamily N-acetyltransferase
MAAARPKRDSRGTAWKVHLLSRDRAAANFDTVIAAFAAALPDDENKLLLPYCTGAAAGAPAAGAAPVMDKHRHGQPKAIGRADPRDAVQPRMVPETRVLLVATQADIALGAAGGAVVLGAAAKALLIVHATRLDVTETRPVGGRQAATFQQVIVSSHVELGTVLTLPEWRRKGAGRALVAALRMCVRAGKMMYTDKPPCMVADALSFWAGVGLVLRGGEGHPLPAQGSRGRAMPAMADRRTLSADVLEEPWTCEHCGNASPHAQWCCSVVSCGMRRPGRPLVWQSTPWSTPAAARKPSLPRATPRPPTQRTAVHSPLLPTAPPPPAAPPPPLPAALPAAPPPPAAAPPQGQGACRTFLAAKRVAGRSTCTRDGCMKPMRGLKDELVGGFCTASCRTAHFAAMGIPVPRKRPLLP